MADDNNHRSYRPVDPSARGGFPDQSGGSGEPSDPLSELARLIGQTDLRMTREGRERDVDPGDPTPDYAAREDGVRGADSYRDYSDSYRLSGRRGDEPSMSDERYRDAPREERGYRDTPYDDVRYGGSHAGARQDYYDPPYAQDGGDRRGDEAGDYYDDDGQDADQDDGLYDEAPRSRGRGGLITVAAVLGLAVVGTAGAFAYRSYFNGAASPPPVIKADTSPSKVVPTAQAGDVGSTKTVFDRLGDRGQGERVVSREEQPIQMNEAMRGTAPPIITSGSSGANPPAGPATRSASPGIPPNASALTSPSPPAIGNEPKKVRTVTIRPDQPAAADPFAARGDQPAARGDQPAAASRSAPARPPAPAAPRPASQAGGPMPLNSPGAAADPTPTASAPTTASAAPTTASAPTTSAPAAAPTRTASRTPAAVDQSGYFVQLLAQKSEDEAQASFRSMQAKFPNLLGNREAVIRRKELGGDKGTYFGAQVGPFGTRDDANQLCESLKSQGGSCLVQKH
jgi:cell division septation protein DedD